MLVLASLLRLGFVANFISEPVLIGFKAGIGVVIVLDQVPKILGIHFAKGPFLQNLFATVHGIPGTSLMTLAVGVSMIVLLVRLNDSSPKAPAPLIAVAAGITAAYLLNLQRTELNWSVTFRRACPRLRFRPCPSRPNSGPAPWVSP